MDTWYKGAFAIAIVAIALVCIGFKQTHTPTKYSYVAHVVRNGETLWEIGERYYTKKESRSFAEFMCDMRNDNGYSVGSGRRFIYPGDTIKIKLEE